MADYLELEAAMINGLKKQYKSDKAEAFKARYFAAKAKLFADILPQIRAEESYLTDHSEKHIENVLNNAFKLISSDIGNSNPLFTGLDLYFLCQVCLFHDVGNIYGRKFHNQRIVDVIDHSFKDLFDGENKRERKLIAEAGRAHTGKHGSDTLQALVDRSEHIQGDHINYCALAAIVRFADELAEGPQRTSSFMLEQGKFPKASELFHRYASCTHIKIDSPNQRIVINYEINIDDKTGSDAEMKQNTFELLNFIYDRIEKLDQERKYYNYYSRIPKSINEIQVNFSFQKENYEIDYRVEPLSLSDLVVPGSSERLFLKTRDDLNPEHIWASISEKMQSEAKQS